MHAWSFTSSKYVQEALKNVEKHIFTEYDLVLPTRVTISFTSGYRPKIDTSRELTDDKATYVMYLIGILRWSVELGRIDIDTEVSKLSSFLAASREGHLDQALHIFDYLKKHHNGFIVFDPIYPVIDENDFKHTDEWKYFYGDDK